MDASRALIFVTFAALAGSAGAQRSEIWKCVEPNGRPLYISDKRQTAGRKCDLISSEINVVETPKAPKSATSTKSPAGFPRESPAERVRASERSRSILQKELSAQEQGLSQARKELAEQESVRSGDERNYARVEKRLQPFKDKVETHQKNIDALKKELGKISR